MKLGPKRRQRDSHGRILETVSLEEVAEMFRDYQRLGSLKSVAKRHNRSIPSVHRLLTTRGFIAPRSRKTPRRRVLQMYCEYVAGSSLADVAANRGVTRQSVFELFKSRRLKLRAREFKDAVVHRGVTYTLSGGTCPYLRSTIGRTKGSGARLLHHVIWEEHNGPVPRGYKVCFVDGNQLNCAIENLELLSNSDQSRKHATGANQFTATAKARLDLLIDNFDRGEKTLAAKLKAA